MTDSAVKPAGQRGIIIVDANALYHLFRTVDPEFYNPNYPRDKKLLNDPKASRIHHYLGILDFLSKHGFKIIIPEMVAMETTSVLACGTSVPDYVHLPEHKRPLMYDRQLVKLLQRVAKGRFPNIELPQMTAPEDEREPHHAPGKHMQEVRKIKDHPAGSKESKEKFNYIRKRVTKNFGEKAIEGYIKEQGLAGRRDVFVLSDDIEALDHISKTYSVPTMNVDGLIVDFAYYKLHAAAGLKSNVTSNEMLDDCAKQITRKGYNYIRTSNWVDRVWETKSHELKFQQGYHPFAKRMEKLAKDLGIKEWLRQTGVDEGQGMSR